MKSKYVLFFVFLAFLFTSFYFASCRKTSNTVSGGWTEWREASQEDSVIFAGARKAFLADSNADSTQRRILEFLGERSKPCFASEQEAADGTNYQFSFKLCIVTVHMAKGQTTGKVTDVSAGDYDGSTPPPFPPPIPPNPVKRDTLIW